MVARLMRRSWRRAAAQRRFPEVDIGKMPVFFANSFPKSGTHLLTQILGGLAALGPLAVSGLPPALTFEGESGQQREEEAILRDFRRLMSGDIGYGHLHATTRIVSALCRPGVAPYFIYRDPRDVVVSHVFYVTDINNRHAHHTHYANELSSFQERLRVSILGRPELDIPFPDIRGRFEPYLAWLGQTEVLALRFEDVVADLALAAGRIFEHALGRGFVSMADKPSAVRTMVAAVDPQRSPTFRSGRVGAWREHFSDEDKTLFKDVSGDLLQHLGYEKGHNW